jgi:hypothetical protein
LIVSADGGDCPTVPVGEEITYAFENNAADVDRTDIFVAGFVECDSLATEEEGGEGLRGATCGYVIEEFEDGLFRLVVVA